MTRVSATAGQLLINEVLPEDMRDYSRTLDKKGLSKLLSEVAQKHPDKYRDVSFALGSIGRKAAQRTGGFSFGLKHLLRAKSGIKRREQLQVKLNEILDDDALPDDKRETRILKLVSDLMAVQSDEIFEESKSEGNPLAMQLAGAGRGNKMNLASLRGSDGLYQDHRNNVIPIPVLRSYSQGLSPLEYWAGTYGARQGVMCLAAGTPVLMADGSSKAVETVEVGERVLTYTVGDMVKPTVVTAVFDNGLRDCNEWLFHCGSAQVSFAATGEHRIYAKRTRTDAAEMLMLCELSGMSCAVGSTAVMPAFDYIGHRKLGLRQTFDLEVEDPSHRFILANRLVVSNSVKFCLHESTEVLMADFTSKAIKDVAVGDMVWSVDEHNKPVPATVCNTFANGLRSCRKFVFYNAEAMRSVDLCATAEHKAYVQQFGAGNATQMKPLGELTGPDDRAVVFDDAVNGAAPRLYAYASSSAAGELETFDLEVDYPSHRFVLANGLVVSNSTQDAGFLSKQLNQIAHRSIVVSDDDDKEPDTLTGLPVDTDDDDSEGSLLAAPTGKYKRNTVLTPKILHDLREQGVKRILVRSPAVSGTADGGVYARDVGVREFGRLPTRFENPGLAAVQALCLDQNTCVRMADGSEKPICDIVPGDTVLGCSIDGILKPVSVLNTYRNGLRLCYLSRFGDRALVSTLSHKLLARVGENDTSICAVARPDNGTKLCAVVDDGTLVALDEQIYVGSRETCDIEVDHPDHLFVLANGLIVSNSEPISQSQLSAKHTGGVAGQSKAVSGFDRISSLIQIPKTMKDGAAHSTVDGRVQSVEPAPAGGHYVTINGTRHYVGVDFTPSVKKGDVIEAGDVISDGLPNPALIVQYKGIGEGRRYFTNTFRQAIRDTGMNANRRNVELLARGLINHVRLTDEIGDFAPDDIVQYNALAASYKPRDGHRMLKPDAAVGAFLEKPYLHYSIGTRVRQSMLKDFQEFGVNELDVHDDPPPFEPEMVRGMANLQHDPDWMTRMFGSGLKTSLLKGVHRGATSDESGTSFIPSRARAVDFGRIGVVRTPEKPKPGKPI